MITIKTATEKDIPVIENILTEVVVWLNSIGQPMWREEEAKWPWLSKRFNISDFRIAYLNGVPAACMAVIDHDPNFWPDVPKGESLFIHKLAVKRFAAKQNLSDALIDHAKQLCIEQNIPFLRLDTHQLRPKLRAVYERNGFVCVAEKCLFEKFHTAFYEYKIPTTQ